jgi:hypothetical protein
MKTIAAYLLVILCLGAAVQEKKDQPATKKPVGKFTIGKETTYVTGPLDKDGYIDYSAALNERLSQGVTPENNANVLLWKAIGPHPRGVTMLPEFFKMLGMEAPPEKGEYFIELDDYLKQAFNIDVAAKREEFNNRLEAAKERPWLPKDDPQFGSWLRANEKPLALVAAATLRTRYFSPAVSPKSEKLLSGLPGTMYEGVSICGELGNALVARAMLRIGQGSHADAWQDLLTCHRLGRLIASGGTITINFVGLGIDARACNGDLAFLDKAKPDAKQLELCLRELRGLAPFPDPVEIMDFAERLTMLDSVMLVDRYGFHYLERLGGSSSATKDAWERIDYLINEVFWRAVDWDPAMRDMNRWFDRVVAAMREKDPNSRRESLEELGIGEIGRMRAEIATGSTATGKAVKRNPTAELRGKALGELMLCLLGPAVMKVQHATDRQRQRDDNVIIGFALAWYQRENGHYPKYLAALTPKYLQQVPLDLCSGKPLIYQTTMDGYLLYSVGVNGEDEGGHGPRDDPPGDDIVVRMPLPPVKAQ